MFIFTQLLIWYADHYMRNKLNQLLAILFFFSTENKDLNTCANCHLYKKLFRLTWKNPGRFLSRGHTVVYESRL